MFWMFLLAVVLFRPVEQEYFRKTGAFPPQHLIVLRREAWEANHWIARGLTESFREANDVFTAAQKGFPYATPWLEAELARGGDVSFLYTIPTFQNPSGRTLGEARRRRIAELVRQGVRLE